MSFEGFGQTIDAFLPHARQAAEELMQDTCVVEFKTGRTTQNESTGKEEAVYEARFISRCKIQDKGLTDSDREVGGRREVQATAQVHLPWDVDEVFTDDRIRITAIGSMTKPAVLGKTYIVGSSADKSLATATRLNVREAS